jgi:hypothetical protein
VSQLRKCLKTPNEPVSHDELELQPDLTYIEKPAKILEENWKQLRNRAIKYCKIQWKHHPEREAAWKRFKLNGFLRQQRGLRPQACCSGYCCSEEVLSLLISQTIP